MLVSSEFNYRSVSEINQSMGRVYAHMAWAVFTSMLVSWFVGSDPALVQFFFTGAVKWIVMFAPLVFIFLVPMILESDPPKIVCVGTLHLFAGLMGLSLAIVFALYTMGSIVGAFMGAAVLFAVMSLYGYFTKRDLDSVGKYAFVALIAIIIVSLINIFIGSSMLQMMISAIAIIVFLALTAYDTQTIREMVSEDTSDAVEVMGALTLYLNFINLFVHLLQLFGVISGKDD